MAKKAIRTEKAPPPIGPYNQAVKAGNILYISGQIPVEPESGEIVNGNIEDETKQVMENIKAIITASGMTMEDIVKCSIFVADMMNFSAINEVYGQYFKEDPPARETVEVSRLPKDVSIEISAIAMA